MTNNKEILKVMATPPKLFLFKRLIFDRMHAYMTVKQLNIFFDNILYASAAKVELIRNSRLPFIYLKKRNLSGNFYLKAQLKEIAYIR